MTKMKDSGIRWIGEIPKEWNLSKIKFEIDELYSGGTPESRNSEYYDDDGENWVSIKDMSNTELVYKTESHITKAGIKDKNLKLVPKETILYSIYATIGKVSKLKINAYINQAILAIYPKKRLFNEYLKYALKILENYALSECSNSIQNNLNAQKVKNFPILQLEINEQKQIVRFLDNKVKKIDEILNDLNNQIELLNKYKKSLITETVTGGLNPKAKMKNSKINWIEMIPESWIENKIKYIAKVNGRVGFKGYSKDDLVGPDEGAYTIGGKHISTNKLNLDEPEYISWEKYYESPEIMIHKNDIIMSQRGTLGKVVIIEDDIGEATINPSLVLLNKIDINNKFLYWIINSDVIRENINVVNTSTAVPMISQTQIGNFKICIPPRKEQDEIANYLDKKCTEIDELIANKQEQIEKMEKYKKSLIYEYVTGKKRVKGAEELYG